MNAADVAALLVAGTGAGTINTIVGSGSLLTFPTLLAVGLPPVAANATNSIGLVPGAVSGAWGYRRELVGQRARVLRLLPAAVIGGLVGALLVLVLPASVFDAVVPALIALGVVLVVAQPRISRAVRGRTPSRERERDASWVVPTFAAASVYGGYFGAAQGVLYMAILGIGVDDGLQRLNAIKNVLAGVVNGIAGAVFVIAAPVDWTMAGIVAVGAVIGGQIGARIGRRLPDRVLRGVIVVVGVVAIVALVR